MLASVVQTRLQLDEGRDTRKFYMRHQLLLIFKTRKRLSLSHVADSYQCSLL